MLIEETKTRKRRWLWRVKMRYRKGKRRRRCKRRVGRVKRFIKNIAPEPRD